MIRSFKCRETEKIFNRVISRAFPENVLRRAFRKLRMIHHSENLMDLRMPPGNRFEALKGNRKGHYSIRINEQWRICFCWSDGDAYDVEIVDYH